MITLKSACETTLSVKKSKFIGLAVRVHEEQQALSEIERRKKQHYAATHNCYAYLLENGAMRYSDDGEPQGTAGLPMLDVIKKSGLSDVLVICTRYFGGTLLGTGGLARAYAQSASDTLSASEKVRILTLSVYKISLSYPVWAKAERALTDEGYTICDIGFSDAVTALIHVAPDKEEYFIEQITNLSHGNSMPVFLGHDLVEKPV